MTTHLDGYWFGWSLIILITVDQSVMRSVKEATIMLQLGVLVSKITSSIMVKNGGQLISDFCIGASSIPCIFLNPNLRSCTKSMKHYFCTTLSVSLI